MNRKMIYLLVCLLPHFSIGAAQVRQPEAIALIDAYLTKLETEKGFSGGLLIVSEGEILFSKGFGWADKERGIPFTSATQACTGSITKAFTAVAIMKLEEAGLLSVNDSLKKFFPAIPRDKASITIHQLLTHSSGLREIPDDGGDYAVIQAPEYLERVFQLPLDSRPGEKAVYTNVGFSILGIIIEQITGVDYEHYLKAAVLNPMGIEHIGYHYPAAGNVIIAEGYRNGQLWGTLQQRFLQAGGGPYWNLKANGGLHASLDDMYRWIMGFEKGTTLSRNSLDKIFSSHIVEEGYDGRFWFGYGCNLYKSRRGTTVIDNGGSNGIYFARLMRLPEEGVAFYMVTNESSLNTNMVLPNITQLYFDGEIRQDALERPFENPQSQDIYLLLTGQMSQSFPEMLLQQNIRVENDMVLLEVGQRLIRERRFEQALMLYDYYTTSFPNIVVAWNDLGDVYRHLDDIPKAIKCYEQALTLRRNNPRATDALQQLRK